MWTSDLGEMQSIKTYVKVMCKVQLIKISDNSDKLRRMFISAPTIPHPFFTGNLQRKLLYGGLLKGMNSCILFGQAGNMERDWFGQEKGCVYSNNSNVHAQSCLTL